MIPMIERAGGNQKEAKRSPRAACCPREWPRRALVGRHEDGASGGDQPRALPWPGHELESPRTEAITPCRGESGQSASWVGDRMVSLRLWQLDPFGQLNGEPGRTGQKHQAPVMEGHHVISRGDPVLFEVSQHA